MLNSSLVNSVALCYVLLLLCFCFLFPGLPVPRPVDSRAEFSEKESYVTRRSSNFRVRALKGTGPRLNKRVDVSVRGADGGVSREEGGLEFWMLEFLEINILEVPLRHKMAELFN